MISQHQFTRQPKQIPWSNFDITLVGVGIVALLCQIGYLMIELPNLPDQVPLHYNAKGEIDRYGSKYELWVLTGIDLFISMLLLPLTNFPHKFNYIGNITDDNCPKFYKVGRQMILFIFAVEAVLFLCIDVGTIWQIQGKISLETFLMMIFVFVGVIITGIICYIIKMKNQGQNNIEEDYHRAD